jgi:hypothetical protein
MSSAVNGCMANKGFNSFYRSSLTTSLSDDIWFLLILTMACGSEISSRSNNYGKRPVWVDSVEKSPF